MRVEKNSIVIRSAEINDAEILNSWWNDGAVMAHAGFPNGLNQSLEATIQQIKENEKKVSQRCIIEVENIRIGELSYRIDSDYAEIGIKICNPEYQNHGLGTKILNMLIEYIFNDKRINDEVYINRIILDTNLNNTRAQLVYEKLGFRRLRVNKDIWKDQLGQLQSSVDYELTREDFNDGVRFIDDQDLREKIARSILYDLPDWFGIPENTEDYIIKSREMPFFAYYKDNRYVGFIVVKETSKYAAEICVMGVLKSYHRQKIGEKLFERFRSYVANKGYEFMQVKTVEAGYYEEYDRTRLFYEKMGFKKLECFPTLWDEWNPCLVMIQSVKKDDVP